MLNRIDRYKVISSGDHLTLRDYVLTEILKGWQPLGGVMGDYGHFYQAMAKRVGDV